MAYSDPLRLIKPYLALLALLVFGIVHFVVDRWWSRFCLRVHGIETGKGGYPLPLPKFQLVPAEGASAEDILCAAIREICVGWPRIGITAISIAIIAVEVDCISDRFLQLVIIILSTAVLFAAQIVFVRLDYKQRQILWCILMYKNDIIAKDLKETSVSKKVYFEASVIRAAAYTQLYSSIAAFVYMLWRLAGIDDGECRDQGPGVSSKSWVKTMLDALFLYQFIAVIAYLVFMHVYVTTVLKVRGDGSPPDVSVYYSRFKMMYYPSELKCVYKFVNLQQRSHSFGALNLDVIDSGPSSPSIRNRSRRSVPELPALTSLDRRPSMVQKEDQLEQQQNVVVI